MLLAMGLISPTIITLYLFLLLDINYTPLLIIPVLIGVIGVINWNCVTVKELIDRVHSLEFQNLLAEQQTKYTLTPKVILKYIDFNIVEIIEINEAMIDWISENKIIDINQLKVGTNWYNLIEHKQDWKIKNQSTACSGIIYSNQLLEWSDKKVFVKWNMYPLSIANKTFAVEWVDDTKNQERILELQEKLEILDSTNRKMINLGFKRALENINAE